MNSHFKKSIVLYIFIFFSPYGLTASSEVEVYYFDNPEDKTRFTKLTRDFRCPKCQSSNLSGSNAPIAQDLKLEIQRLILEDKSNKEIIEFLKSRYGDYILYKPPLDKRTLILWSGPFALLVIVISWLLIWRLSSIRKFRD